MIKNYFRKLIAIGAIAISLVAINPIGVNASWKLYDSNNNVLSNYKFNSSQNINNYITVKLTGDYLNNNMSFLDAQGNIVTNKWIRKWDYNDQYKYVMRDAWYYFDSNGFRAVGWKEINGKWYYFSEYTDSDGLGILYLNDITPDGYKVDENGVWIQ